MAVKTNVCDPYEFNRILINVNTLLIKKNRNKINQKQRFE